jgi:hypothetical protein
MPSGSSSIIINNPPIQNASYRPAAYMMPARVAPVQIQPQTMAAPSYWGN